MRHVLLPLLLALPAATVQAQCLVSRIELVDHSRSAGVPYASAADAGAQPVRVRALAWAPSPSAGAAAPVATSAAHPTYAELINDVAPGLDAAGILVARYRFYGANIDSAAAAVAVRTPSQCTRVASLAAPNSRLVIIVGAFAPALYEGAAADLAARGITTIALGGTESSLRLLINHLASLGWPVDRMVLVGHGAGGSVVNLVAMGNAAVRGIVSLDGFEALERTRHPGLTGDPAWRPGALRAPTLHWRPSGHPDQDTVHHVAAARSALIQVTLSQTVGRQSMTAPELALAPPALRPLVGAAGAADQAIATQQTVAFIATVLGERPASAATIAAFADSMRRTIPARYVVTTRPALAEPAIVTDGRLDEPIWRDARTLPDATDTELRVTEDCEWLYAAIVPRRPAPFITELFVGARSGPSLLLHASASLCWAYGKAEVAASDCNKTEAWWGGSRTNQTGDAPVGEYMIAKRALGLTGCASAAGLPIGALTGGWGRTTTYPANVDKARRDTWGRISGR